MVEVQHQGWVLLRLLFLRNKKHTKIVKFFLKKEKEQHKIVLLAPWGNPEQAEGFGTQLAL